VTGDPFGATCPGDSAQRKSMVRDSRPPDSMPQENKYSETPNPQTAAGPRIVDPQSMVQGLFAAKVSFSLIEFGPHSLDPNPRSVYRWCPLSSS